MAMKRLLWTLMVLGACALAFAQDYPFSIVESGTGEQAVILIPGFACSGDVWTETVEALKDDCTCYVLTFAGFAGTAPEEHPSFGRWKTQIAEFIKDKRMERPVLMGHSMGGGLALAIAAEFPELVQKVVVVDALPCLQALTVPGFKPSSDNHCREVVNRIVSMDDSRFAQMQRMGAATLTTDSLKCTEIVNWGLASDRKTYAELFCDFSNTDLRECIRYITVPSLILLEPSFRNLDTMIKEQYKNLSGAQIKYADKGLHFIMFDDKEWFLSQIRAFITER
ncbi:alpha/beta hydrolase fold protein [Bacteroides helcogenes P 36-108]|uniref:Alpha/beta hydrolase fold protein n=2 Tax=Bacteroides helcogenes TaxID=290053 RepID=E6SWA1_BACT6|nr:alpha/beta hydrolase fold protein [Bacteroides helcogenes P 36-108]